MVVGVRVFKTLVVCLCSLLLFVGYTFAQETTGGIVGTVKDPSGASVPNATVIRDGVRPSSVPKQFKLMLPATIVSQTCLRQLHADDNGNRI